MVPWQWVHGQISDTVTAEYALRELARGDDVVSVIVGEDVGQAYRTQVLVAALQRTTGTFAPVMAEYAAADRSRFEALAAAATRPVVLVADTDRAAIWAEQSGFG